MAKLLIVEDDGPIVRSLSEYLEAEGYTPVGGTVTAAARETALFTELVIADNGPGFDSAELPHLFERFYKGRSAAADSIGIGLALARSILAAQNGTITAANAPKGGAVFTVRFYKSVI